MIAGNILEAIGKTPLVKLNHLTSKHEASVYVKCEFLNPGGSIKDRIAFRMVKDAHDKKEIQPGDTLIEPTSGNTGIGLALAGAIYKYKVIIVMPEKMSREKEVVLQALGAEIIRTPSDAPSHAPEGHIGLAKKLEKDMPRARILDQYSNPNNFLAHYEGTSLEILQDLNNQVDMLVACAGTGGTLSGVGKRFREQVPDCEIIGVDPEGSILAGEEEVKPYEVEGIGYDFIPESLNRDVVTKWVKTNDKDSFQQARRAIREEGILCGGSSGAALSAGLQEAKRLKAHQNCVIILPDGIRNYLGKFLDDNWLKEKGLANA